MMIEVLKNWTAPVLRHLTAPPRCEACSHEVLNPPDLCETCRGRLKPLQGSRCSICALPFEGEALSEHRCQGCLTRPPHFSKVTAVFEFDGTAASLLHAAKFGRRTAALELLTQAGQELFERTLQRFSPDWLLPVPLSWRRRFVRGFNQSYLLTHYLREGAASRIPIFSGVKRRHLEAQAKQGLKERLSRLRGVFSVSGGAALAGAGVLIVDDVLTTGATAEALSAALKNEGVREVEVFVLTRVRRMHG